MRTAAACLILALNGFLLFGILILVLSGGLNVPAHPAQTLSLGAVAIFFVAIGYGFYAAGSQLGLWLALNRWIRAVSDYYAGVHDAEK